MHGIGECLGGCLGGRLGGSIEVELVENDGGDQSQFQLESIGSATVPCQTPQAHSKVATQQHDVRHKAIGCGGHKVSLR